MNSDQLEKYSSAITLSDMEIFVFPELMYSLVLANIMSPVVWQWRETETFKKLKGKSPYRRLMRLKQFIMDRYEFNLDLDTWGLTSRDVELARFKDHIAPEEVIKSNALFGYTGDKYYFDVDIRRHFGLDKYDGDVIPYWKTETAEAMGAFRYKEGYSTGAGECVSLSTLYAAAAFVVCGIPLEDIYMVLTPLHSQNFIDIQEGVLTNNRRLVTKSMWFNGTALSDKAQRALRNEQVTIVAHPAGFVHCLYDKATIDSEVYQRFTGLMDKYLTADLTPLIVANFLRCNSMYQKYFQFCRRRRGEQLFIKAEVLFHYEHGSTFRIYDASFDKLLAEVPTDDYVGYKVVDRLCCEQLMAFIEYEKINMKDGDSRDRLAKYLSAFVPDADKFVAELFSFVHMEAKLPDAEKEYVPSRAIELSTEMSREEVIEYLESIRDDNVTTDLAFYAYRDMKRCSWDPFMKAAIERNPVSIEAMKEKSIKETYQWLEQMDNGSIYDGTRLAQPDEVINFHRGDGIEKAILLANIIHYRDTDMSIVIEINDQNILLKAGEDYYFTSNKGLDKKIIVGT